MADITFGSEVTYNSAATSITSVDWLDSTHIVVSFVDDSDSWSGKAIVGVVTGNSIAWGTAVEYDVGATYNNTPRSVTVLDSTHFVVGYSDVGDGGKAKAIVGVVSGGDTITFGSIYTASTGSTEGSAVTALDSTHFVMSYSIASGLDNGQAIVGVVSGGDTITFGTAVNFHTTHTVAPTSIATLDSTHVVIGYRQTNGYAVVGTISSGDVIAFGTAVQMMISTGGSQLDVAVLDSTHFVLATRDDDSGWKGRAVVGVVSSGDTITSGTIVTYSTGDALDNSLTAIDTENFIVAFKDSNNLSKGTAIPASVSGDVITFGTEVVFADAATAYTSIAAYDNTTFVISFQDGAASNYGKAIIGTYASAATDNSIFFGNNF